MSSSFFTSIERVVLAEKITLPEVTKVPVTRQWLLEGNKYIDPFNVYKDTKAKFFFNVATPMVSKGEPTKSSGPKPNVKGLSTSGYTRSNYIELIIPKYILLEFKDEVPKGTEFLIGCVGDSIDIDDMRIIGLYTVGGN